MENDKIRQAIIDGLLECSVLDRECGRIANVIQKHIRNIQPEIKKEEWTLIPVSAESIIGQRRIENHTRSMNTMGGDYDNDRSAEEKARIFGEYCGYAGAYMWHAGFHKWMNKYSGEYTKEGLMLTTTELFASPEFLAYYEERKSK